MPLNEYGTQWSWKYVHGFIFVHDTIMYSIALWDSAIVTVVVGDV